MSETSLASTGSRHFGSAQVGIDPVEQVHLMENHDRSFSLWRGGRFQEPHPRAHRCPSRYVVD
jgi:hypothetical protein